MREEPKTAKIGSAKDIPQLFILIYLIYIFNVNYFKEKEKGRDKEGFFREKYYSMQDKYQVEVRNFS